MTPMMTQHQQIKSKHPDCLIFFRLGDFYELFYDDALTASKELGLALTGRDCGEEERAPMCGVPHHTADGYIARLVKKGYKVAVCEQMENPKAAEVKAKGLVKREVVRIVTPGTVTDIQMLDESRNNYIVCVNYTKKDCALAAADVSTGDFLAAALENCEPKTIIDELAKYSPAEILVSEHFPFAREVEEAFALRPNVVPSWTFSTVQAYKCLTVHFDTHHLEGFGLAADSAEVPAAGALLAYLQETQKNALHQITAIKRPNPARFMVLDRSTRQNLELTEPLREKRGRQYTLLGVIDHTCTAMGARLLRNWLENPLLDLAQITRRQDAVEEWHSNTFLRAEARDVLKTIHDIMRLVSRISGQNATGRDMAALRASFLPLPELRQKLAELQAPLHAQMFRTFDTLEDLLALLENALADEPPATVREGGLFKKGYSPELDKLLTVKENGARWLAELEQREKSATGIKSLKVRFNKVFGYYIEVTNANKHLAPEHYTRKQTMANAERFTTDELNGLAAQILGAEERRVELEYNLFDGLRRDIVAQIERIQHTASIVAALDAILSLAQAADVHRYTRPIVNDRASLYIQGGRHPVLEGLCDFVPNDTHLDTSDRRMLVLTGPNMAGKSTYMRQVALITVLAHMGGFVPADEAIIGVVDRIFTRVGASDDLATGQSTFMVEMTEVANILHHATNKSLILMDEVGRGTSTYDGLSIAWAVLEHIANEANIGAKCLFATHYHEITALERRMQGVKNYSFAVREQGDKIAFLRKLIPGGADKSYGIQVARLAGLPPSVIRRAKNVLLALETVNSAHGIISTDTLTSAAPIFLDEMGDKEYVQQDLCE